jgi:hypothetical protein
VVAADSERHAIATSRFFSDALRACFRMTDGALTLAGAKNNKK